jgi:hypothetical protein
LGENQSVKLLWIMGALAAVGAVMGYIRLAPSVAARWHIALHPPGGMAAGGPATQAGGNAAWMIIPPGQGDLAQLDAIAVATPRTHRLAGSAAEGRITWITRSALIGYPDYTTAEAGAQGVMVYARARFGNRDHGVNAARLTQWRAGLPQP